MTIKYRLHQEQYTCAIQKLSTEVAAVKSEPFYTSFRHCVAKTWEQEGARGFYRGLPINLARVIPTNALFFAVYEAVNSTLAVGCK
jgi:hypothetical protein